VKILKVDPEGRKIGLSLKAYLEESGDQGADAEHE
jgi:ribosomal protein S1